MAVQRDGAVIAPPGVDVVTAAAVHLKDLGGKMLPNQRMKLPRRSGHIWWYRSFLMVAAATRSLCAIR